MRGIPKILDIYFREVPMVEKLPWRWCPELKKGAKYGAGSWEGGGRRLYVLRWGWWQVELFLF